MEVLSVSASFVLETLWNSSLKFWEKYIEMVFYGSTRYIFECPKLSDCFIAKPAFSFFWRLEEKCLETDISMYFEHLNVYSM